MGYLRTEELPSYMFVKVASHVSVGVQGGLRCCPLADALKPKDVGSILREGERVPWV